MSDTQYTFRCGDCDREFAIDPVSCTYCGSWNTEHVEVGDDG